MANRQMTSPDASDPRKIFFTRVPLTGLQNLFEAEGPRTRRFWTMVIIVATLCATYTVCQCMIEALRGVTVIDVSTYHDENRLPFPNISVCAPIVINRTYVGEKIKIPNDVLAILNKRNRSIHTFMDDFSKYVAISGRVKNLNAQDIRYFDRVYAVNFDHGNETGSNASVDYDVDDIGRKVAAFYKNSQPSCIDMITDCAFDDQPFDCCDGAESRLFEEGVCYTLSIPSTGMSAQQLRTGPTAGLTFTATVDRDDIGSIESDHNEGFQIHIDHVASPINSPVAVPLGAQAEVRLKARYVIRRGSCLSEITDKQTRMLKTSSYYDPRGTRCKEEIFMKLLTQLMGCRLPVYPEFSNHAYICSPRVSYAVESTISKEMPYGRQVDMKKLRAFIRRAYYSDQCLPACSDWEYDILVNYLTLTKHTSHMDTDATFSRVSIFYGELSHTQFVHRPAVSVYSMVYHVGGIASLYLGLSMTAIVQLTFYGFHWVRKVKLKVRYLTW